MFSSQFPSFYVLKAITSFLNTGIHASALISRSSYWYVLLFPWQMLKDHGTLLVTVVPLWNGLPSRKEKQIWVFLTYCGMQCTEYTHYLWACYQKEVNRQPGGCIVTSSMQIKIEKLWVEHYTLSNCLLQVLWIVKYISRNRVSHSSSLLNDCLRIKVAP